MFNKLWPLIALLFVQNICLATMFFPLPFEKQVEEATSGVEVRLNSSKVFKNAHGAIMTEYSFDVVEAYNLPADDLENQKLKLTMPGGTFEGVSSMIDGAPVFTPEERSFLLLKKIEAKIYLSNFTLGKFKIQEHEGKIYYVSEVFPTDPNIGRITKDKMVELMKTKWKTSFSMTPDAILEQGRKISNPKSLTALFKNSKIRQPAQAVDVDHGVPLFFWSAIGIVALFFMIIFFKLSKNEHQHKPE